MRASMLSAAVGNCFTHGCVIFPALFRPSHGFYSSYCHGFVSDLRSFRFILIIVQSSPSYYYHLFRITLTCR